MKEIRPNHAEGTFYSASAHDIERLFAKSILHEEAKMDTTLYNHPIIGGVVPHAGHIYCSREAVHFFEIVRQSCQLFDVVVIINPNHTGKGLPISVDGYDAWQSPLGVSDIDKSLAAEIGIPIDRQAQSEEHSGEVILPYIHYFLGKEIPILPICVGMQSNANAKLIANKLFEACKQLKRKPLIVASSDFNHYASPEIGAKLDAYALDAIIRKDTDEFERRIHERDISICGYGAILSLMHYAQHTGEYSMHILRKGNSGEIYPSHEVVDYVSLLCVKD